MKTKFDSKTIELYSEFLVYVWEDIRQNTTSEIKNKSEYYYQLFFMIKQDPWLYSETKQLLKWMDENNNGKLPNNLQMLFNEWILEQKL